MPNPSILFWPLKSQLSDSNIHHFYKSTALGWLIYSLPAIQSQFPSFQHSSFLQVRAEEVVAMESEVTK
jgi:hypothetical protein